MIKNIFLILVLAMTAMACSRKTAILSHSDFDFLHKGMSFEEFDELMTNDYSKKIEIDDYIRVRGAKYHYVQVYFLNQEWQGGNSATYYYDPYFLVFDQDDKLLAMGYPFEFNRHDDGLMVDIGEALTETITRYEN